MTFGNIDIVNYCFLIKITKRPILQAQRSQSEAIQTKLRTRFLLRKESVTDDYTL